MVRETTGFRHKSILSTGENLRTHCFSKSTNDAFRKCGKNKGRQYGASGSLTKIKTWTTEMHRIEILY